MFFVPELIFRVTVAQDVSCPSSVLISLSGNGVEAAASYQRLGFVKAAAAFVPSQNWGPSAGLSANTALAFLSGV